MQGPFHEFFLVSKDKYSYKEYLSIHRGLVREFVILSDDLIWYINDSLNWIPTTNPANPKEWQGYGLNLYGPTIINKDGADRAWHIFGAWKRLFTNGTELLHLRGPWSAKINDADTAENWDYLPISITRDVLITALETLESYADRTLNGNFFILHKGL